MTDEQTKTEEALSWVLEYAADELSYYLESGDPFLDYGAEWPEVARQRATYARAIAEHANCEGDARQWNDLAERYEDSAREAEADGGKCSRCNEPNGDGEGYDGLCGNCADADCESGA